MNFFRRLFGGKGQKEDSVSKVVINERSSQHRDDINRRTPKLVIKRRMPKSITYKGMTYRSTGVGRYQSDDDSILPSLVLAYLLLSPSEQPTFAEQNPEVKDLSFDGYGFNGGESGGGGAERSFGSDDEVKLGDQKPTDEVNPGGGGEDHQETDRSETGNESPSSPDSDSPSNSGDDSFDSGGGSSDSGVGSSSD